MKISKIPGLGRFGIFIDDVDFEHLSKEEWLEIGQLHLNSLVTIIRNTKLNHFDYMKLIHQWGTPRNTNTHTVTKKYNCSFPTMVENQHAKKLLML
jgi:hypothetical protein